MHMIRNGQVRWLPKGDWSAGAVCQGDLRFEGSVKHHLRMKLGRVHLVQVLQHIPGCSGARLSDRISGSSRNVMVHVDAFHSTQGACPVTRPASSRGDSGGFESVLNHAASATFAGFSAKRNVSASRLVVGTRTALPFLPMW